MAKEKIQIEDPKPIMFRPTKEHEKAIQKLMKDKPLVDNKSDAIRYLLDLGIEAEKSVSLPPVTESA